jgi:hypothetical protein
MKLTYYLVYLSYDSDQEVRTGLDVHAMKEITGQKFTEYTGLFTDDDFSNNFHVLNNPIIKNEINIMEQYKGTENFMNLKFIVFKDITFLYKCNPAVLITF